MVDFLRHEFAWPRLFQLHGRRGRVSFLVAWVTALAGFLMLSAAKILVVDIAFVLRAVEYPSGASTAGLIAIGAATSYVMLAALVQRLHDIGWSGWWSVPFLMVGFAAIILDHYYGDLATLLSVFQLALLMTVSFVRGEGDNRFGLAWPEHGCVRNRDLGQPPARNMQASASLAQSVVLQKGTFRRVSYAAGQAVLVLPRFFGLGLPADANRSPLATYEPELAGRVPSIRGEKRRELLRQIEHLSLTELDELISGGPSEWRSLLGVRLSEGDVHSGLRAHRTFVRVRLEKKSVDQSLYFRRRVIALLMAAAIGAWWRSVEGNEGSRRGGRYR